MKTITIGNNTYAIVKQLGPDQDYCVGCYFLSSSKSSCKLGDELAKSGYDTRNKTCFRLCEEVQSTKGFGEKYVFKKIDKGV